MTIEVKTITTPFIFNASINCFLVKANNEFILIDTGRSNKRKTIEKELENSNCHPGNLKLIILTHGDFDHSGNAAYFRRKFRSKIALCLFWKCDKLNVLEDFSTSVMNISNP